MYCVVASGLYIALVPSACCQATIAFTFSVVTGMLSWVRKSCAHCSRLFAGAPAATALVDAVAPADVVALAAVWAWSSSAEKSLDEELEAVADVVTGEANCDWISAMRASTAAMPSIASFIGTGSARLNARQ